MANISMHCHPATPTLKADSLSVEWEIQPEGRLWLRYFVECDLYSLIVPAEADPDRRDGLWQSSCFELFLCEPGASSYLEFNFSPSGQWAAYQFTDYRTDMADFSLETPEIGGDCSDTHFALEATIALPDMLNTAVEAALCAVIHERGDIKSYWALKHPQGDPDFHHKDCFALKLAAPERA
jgi:hypothetical protein